MPQSLMQQNPCTVPFEDYDWQALFAYVHKTAILPNFPPTLQQATWWLAQLGGFLARKGDGYPGVKVLWQGWQRLFDIAQTWLIFNPTQLMGKGEPHWGTTVYSKLGISLVLVVWYTTVVMEAGAGYSSSS